MGRSANIERVLNALGDPTRRAIVERLTNRPYSVSQLATAFGITLTGVGQHLQILEECRLVKTEKVGRVRTCQIETKGLDDLEKWIHGRRTLWEKRLDQLGKLLAEDRLTGVPGKKAG